MSAQQGRLGQRLSAFKQKFSQLLGPKQHGYGELGQLEQPLVGHQASADTDSAYMQQHGVPRPGSQAPPPQGAAQYERPVSGQQGQWQAPPGSAAPPASSNAVPDPADELRALSGLAAEAAEILFEMAALHDSSEVARDMLDKAAHLQAQLRGMIGDFREGDEAALAQALEAFDTLTSTVEEYHVTLSGGGGGAPAAPGGAGAAAGPSAGGAVGGVAAAPVLQPPPGTSSNPFQPSGGAPVATAPGHKPAGEEPPLISFD